MFSFLSNVNSLAMENQIDVFEVVDLEIPLTLQDNKSSTFQPVFDVQFTEAEIVEEVSDLLNGKCNSKELESYKSMLMVKQKQRLENPSHEKQSSQYASIVPIGVEIVIVSDNIDFKQIADDDPDGVQASRDWLKTYNDIIGKSRAAKKTKNWIEVERKLYAHQSPFTDHKSGSIDNKQTMQYDGHIFNDDAVTRLIGKEFVQADNASIMVYEGDPVIPSGFAIISPWSTKHRRIDWTSYTEYISSIKIGDSVHVSSLVYDGEYVCERIDTQFQYLDLKLSKGKEHSRDTLRFYYGKDICSNRIFLNHTKHGYSKARCLESSYVFKNVRGDIETQHVKHYFLPSIAEWITILSSHQTTLNICYQYIVSILLKNGMEFKKDTQNAVLEFLKTYGHSIHCDDQVLASQEHGIHTHSIYNDINENKQYQSDHVQTFLEKCVEYMEQMSRMYKINASRDVLQSFTRSVDPYYEISSDIVECVASTGKVYRIKYKHDVIGHHEKRIVDIRATSVLNSMHVFDTRTSAFTLSNQEDRGPALLVENGHVHLLQKHNDSSFWSLDETLSRVPQYKTIEMSISRHDIEIGLASTIESMRAAIKRLECISSRPKRQQFTYHYNNESKKTFVGDKNNIDAIEFVTDQHSVYIDEDNVNNMKVNIYYGTCGDMLKMFIDTLLIRMDTSTIDSILQHFPLKELDLDLGQIERETFKSILQKYVKDKELPGNVLRMKHELVKIMQVVRNDPKYVGMHTRLQHEKIRKLHNDVIIQRCCKLIGYLVVYIQLNLPNVVLTPLQGHCKAKFGLKGYPLNADDTNKEIVVGKTLIEYMLCVAESVILPKWIQNPNKKIEIENGADIVQATIRTIIQETPSMAEQFASVMMAVKRQEAIIDLNKKFTSGVWESYRPSAAHMSTLTYPSNKYPQAHKRLNAMMSSKTKDATPPNVLYAQPHMKNFLKKPILKTDGHQPEFRKNIEQMDVHTLHQSFVNHTPTLIQLTLIEALLTTPILHNDTHIQDVHIGTDATVWNRISQKLQIEFKALGFDSIYEETLAVPISVDVSIPLQASSLRVVLFTREKLPAILSRYIHNGEANMDVEAMTALQSALSTAIIKFTLKDTSNVKNKKKQNVNASWYEEKLIHLYWFSSIARVLQKHQPIVFTGMSTALSVYMDSKQMDYIDIASEYESQRENLKQSMIQTMDTMENEERRAFSEMKKRGMIDLRGQLLNIRDQANAKEDDENKDNGDNSDNGDENEYRGENDDGDDSGQDEY